MYLDSKTIMIIKESTDTAWHSELTCIVSIPCSQSRQLKLEMTQLLPRHKSEYPDSQWSVNKHNSVPASDL